MCAVPLWPGSGRWSGVRPRRTRWRGRGRTGSGCERSRARSATCTGWGGRWRFAARPRDVPVAEPAPAVASPDDSFEPGLAPAIARLSEAQRCAVVLVVGFGYTLREAAEVLGVTASTVHRDSERALARLRSELEVENAH